LPIEPPKLEEQIQAEEIKKSGEAARSTYRGGKQAEVLYAFTARNDKELSINLGDIINVYDNSSEWWYGELNGKIGLFPGNYTLIKKQNIQVKRASNSKILELQAQCGFFDTKPTESAEVDTNTPIDKVTIISPRESLSPSESITDTPDNEELESSQKLTSKERLKISMTKHKEKIQEAKKDEPIVVPELEQTSSEKKGHVRQNSKDKLKAMIAKKKEERAARTSNDATTETDSAAVQEDLDPAEQEGVPKGHKRRTSLDRLKASIAKRKENKNIRTSGDGITAEQLEDFLNTQIEKTIEPGIKDDQPPQPVKSALKARTANNTNTLELLPNQADIALIPKPVRNLESNTELGALDLAYFTQNKISLDHINLKRISLMIPKRPPSRRPLIDGKRAPINNPSWRADEEFIKFKAALGLDDEDDELDQKPKRIQSVNLSSKAGRPGFGMIDISAVKLRSGKGSAKTSSENVSSETVEEKPEPTPIKPLGSRKTTDEVKLQKSITTSAIKLPGFNPADIKTGLRKTIDGSSSTKSEDKPQPTHKLPTEKSSPNLTPPKKKGGLDALLQWTQRVTEGYRDVNINNFTTSFQDGMAFCAILHHYHPTKINFNSLDKTNRAQNLELAFSVAEKLGVTRLLDVEDIIDIPVPDRLSMITYISEIHKVIVKGKT